MKDNQIKIQIEQLLAAIDAEEAGETAENFGRVCRLQDAKEYLRRAWHAIDDSEFSANDTAYEQMRPICSKCGSGLEMAQTI